MFTIDPNITGLMIKEKDLAKIFFSMNNHQVATPEMMLEEARSYIMFFREANGKLSSYIGLHLLMTGRNLFYTHSSNPFPEGERESIEEEALCFVEGLGAMLDEVDFTKMSSGDKKRWIDEQEMFTQKREPESAPEDRNEEAQPQDAPSAQQSPQTRPPVTEAVPPAQQAPEPPQAQPAQYASQTPAPQQAPQTRPPVTEAVPSAQQAPELPQTPAPQQSPQSHPPVTEAVPPAQQAPEPPQAQPAQYAPQIPAPQQAPPAALPVQERPQESSAALEIRQTAAPQPQETAGREAAIHAPAAEDERHPDVPPAPQPPAQMASPSPEEAPAAARAAGGATATPGAAKRSQDLMQKAIRAGIVKPPKPSVKKEAQATAGVVSRDREALARLLASF